MRPCTQHNFSNPISSLQNGPISIPPFIPQQPLPSLLENSTLSNLISLNNFNANNSLIQSSLFGNDLVNKLSLQQQVLSNPIDLSYLLSTMKFQQNLQTTIFRTQVEKLLELKNALSEKITIVDSRSVSHSESPVQDLKIPQMAIPSLEINKAIKKDEGNLQNLQNKSKITSKKEERKEPRKDHRGSIRDIVMFFLENYGRINDACFIEEMEKYRNSKDLLEVFNMLMSKYSSTIKTKEEMIKYTLRRAFKFIKGKLRKETNMKGVSKTLCNKYFQASLDEISNTGNEEEFLKSRLPFRKNSKNKTMNASFISEIFSSEEFCKDYEAYLKSFDDVLEADNNSKIDKLIETIEDYIRDNRLNELKKYKRIPWPRLWIINTKKIAQELPKIGKQEVISPMKKTKQN